MSKSKHKAKKKYRNNGAPSGPRPRPAAAPRRGARRFVPRRGDPPDFWTTVAAVAGGAGSAVLSGLVVNQKILSPEASAIGMIGVGGATAYFAEGNTRVVGNSMASAGAGQLALALMARRALAQANAPAAGATQTAQAAAPAAASAQPAATPGAALPPPVAAPAARPANSASGAGYVVDIFREAASQLDALDEDQWRMGMRDGVDGGADVYDLDDLMAA